MKNMILTVSLIFVSIFASANTMAVNMTCEELAVQDHQDSVHKRVEAIQEVFKQLGNNPADRAFLKIVYKTRLRELDIAIAQEADVVFDCSK